MVEVGKPLEIRSLGIPPLRSGQVLVDVAYSGICHSQLLEMHGKKGPDRFLPHTLGHEGSGIVLEVASGVTKVRPGDHVVLSWIKGSGADVPSTIYESERGSVNSGAISTFMKRTVTCENRLTRIPTEMPLREAALLGCAIPTGAGIVVNTAKVHAGSSVAVFGAGGIGLSAILAARLQNAAKIIAVDVIDHKLQQARRAGATDLVNAQKQDPVGKIQELTGTGGADYAIEAAGRRETMEAAFRAVRPNGGLCVLAGNLPQGETITIDPFDLIRGKRIVGTWGGESNPDRDFPEFALLYIQGKLDLESLITDEYILSDINVGLESLAQGKVGRALVSMR